ncbi:MAG: DUF2130 domain-containing protein [Bacteroidetes bacterium]|nr:DUF2130 domain-containing protein [Bacteroidota bacterium]
MEEKTIIPCPKCGTEINVSEALYHHLTDKIKKEYDKKSVLQEKEWQDKLADFEVEKTKMSETIRQEVQAKLRNEKSIMEKEIRSHIMDEASEQLKSLREELDIKSGQVKELNKTKADLERLKREKEELREQIAMEKEQEFTSKLKDEKLKIQRQVEEVNLLKIREKEKLIEDLKDQLNEAKRRADQGSMQLQGEIQELELEARLKSLYPYDEINEIKKGQKGADIIQTVRTKQGEVCGKLYYESKRTKTFDYNWLQKLRDDNLEKKADVLILVTEKLPEEIDKYVLKDGVWICSFVEISGLSFVLRYGLIQVHAVTTTQQGMETKMEWLYNYLTGKEFKGQFEAIIEGFVTLRDGYNDEKLKMMKIWKEREKQLTKILVNAVNFYGSLKGIAGASIPDIKMLESSEAKLLDEIK